MKMLAAPATVLALWAVSAQAATNDDIAKRLEPVGQVCVQGQECKGMEVAATAGGGGGAKSPDDVITKHCNACHGTGLLGAPKIGDTAAWGKNAPTTRAVSMEFWPKPSQVLTPCRRKAPAPIARMTS
jgi:cytochrome c5